MSNSEGKKKLSEQLISWVNGERESKDRTLFIMECSKRSRPEQPEEEHLRLDRRRLRSFLNFYPIAALTICVVIVAILLSVVLAMPPFGRADNPTNNEVSEHYLEHTKEETGSLNAVTGMILSYRGFDTLGESCVLFLAVTCVMILLLRDERNTDSSDLQKQSQEDAIERDHHDIILQNTARILIPFIFMFALYVLVNGETSPGGGFSGGTILGCALILYASAFGFDRIHTFFNWRIYNFFRIFGLMLYALLYGYFVFTGANGITDPLLSMIGGLGKPIDLAVGLVVACTVYGFYALYAKGDI